MDNKFSIFYAGITSTIPDGELTLEGIYNLIKQPTYQLLCEQIQKIKNPDKKALKIARNQIKKKLAYVTVAGVFDKRHNDGLKEQSGYAAIDVDDIKNISEVKKELLKDPYVHLMYISPSGEGIKLFIKLPLSIDNFKDYVLSFYDYLNQRYNIPIDSLDKKTYDISRACYLSYDPEVYYNPKAKKYTDLEHNLDQDKKKDTSRSAIEMKEVVKMLFCGKTKKQIYKSMEVFSKWASTGEKYQDFTFNKAKNYVDACEKLTLTEKRTIIPVLAEKILDEHKIYAMRTDKYTELWIYSNGIYVPNRRTYLEKYIEKILKHHYDMAIVIKVVDMIKPNIYIEPSEFFSEEDPKFICVQNGVLNIFTKELLPFSSKYRFFNKLPIKYDPTVFCKHTKNHYETIFDKKDIPLIQEIYGYLLYREYNIQKAFLFTGDGGNGKSISMEQMKAFLGVDNTVNISLQAFAGDGFIKSNVHKKLANLCTDMGSGKLEDTSIFREMTGSDMMTAQRKFLEPISFKNYAKMIFAVNTLPHITENTRAFWRRWCYIEFNVSFISQEDYNNREKNGTLKHYHRVADTKISHKLSTPEELSGVLNWALDGFARINKKESFSYEHDEEKTKQKMQSRESSVMLFVQKHLKRVAIAEQFEKHDDVYKKYLNFCNKNPEKRKPESNLKFRKILENHSYSLERKKVGVNWEHRWYFVKLFE